MTGPRSRWGQRLALLLCAVAVALAGGCGQARTPGEAVPALGDRLDRVDQAIAAGDYRGARAHLDRLVAETARADVSGEISEEQADQILDAVADVLAGLPDPAEDSEPSDPSRVPTPSAELEDLDGDEGDEEDADNGEDDKGKGKDKGKGNDKDEGD